MNGTIRDNIIFYSSFDAERYNQVVNACQLDKDFENLKHGDLTEIINIESYKQYNYMETISKLSEREAFAKERSCCSCFIV